MSGVSMTVAMCVYLSHTGSTPLVTQSYRHSGLVTQSQSYRPSDLVTQTHIPSDLLIQSHIYGDLVTQSIKQLLIFVGA